jgi:GAF domain-containing protein
VLDLDAVTGPARRHVLDSGVAGQILARDPAADAAEVVHLGTLGCSALLLVPVIFDGCAVGLVEVARRQDEPWTRMDAEHAQILARQLGPLLAGEPVLT